MDIRSPLFKRFVGHVDIGPDGKPIPGTEVKGSEIGVINLFRLMLAKHHPDIDIDTVVDIVGEIGNDKLTEIIANSYGAAEKNGSGPAPSR